MGQSGADYALGQTFGRAVQSQPRRQPARLNAVISDLLAGDLSLRAPLRELVALPAFLEAEPLAASATAAALVGALLHDLAAIYRDDTVARMRQFLHGYFGLAEPEPGESNAGADSPPAAGPAAQAQHRGHRIDQRRQRLKQLLQERQWQQADRETWQILVESCGACDGDHLGAIWSAIPCALLYDINRLWCDASCFRFGFSVQRALWEQAVAEHNAARTKPDRAPAIKAPAEVFAECLQPGSRQAPAPGSSSTAPLPDVSLLPVGFFPRGANQRVWGDHRGWVVEWQSGCLIDNFAVVHARLVDCGIRPVELDGATRKQLQALYGPVHAEPKPKPKPEPEPEPQPEPEPAPQRDAPAVNERVEGSPPDRQRGTTNWGGAILLLLALFGWLLGSVAGPTVTKECSSSGVFSRAFCYLSKIPSGLSR